MQLTDISVHTMKLLSFSKEKIFKKWCWQYRQNIGIALSIKKRPPLVNFAMSQSSVNVVLLFLKLYTYIPLLCYHLAFYGLHTFWNFFLDFLDIVI